jgi:hypothetical protein
MTPAQMTAIQGMNLTPQDSFAIMQKLGINMGRGESNTANSSNNRQGNGDNFFIPPGGAPPDAGGGNDRGGSGQGFSGGGQNFGGQGFNPGQMATAQASGSQTNRNNFMISALLNELIQYLQGLTSK